MNVLDFQEERVLFGPEVAPATHRRLQAAVAARSDRARAERLFLEILEDDPDCLPARFALYKFYFNGVEFEKAATTALNALAEAARQGGLDPDWTRLDRHSILESEARCGEHPAHFYCFTLKALAFIRLRQGRTMEARRILTKLAALDPEDRVGGSVIRSLADRIEDGDA